MPRQMSAKEAKTMAALLNKPGRTGRPRRVDVPRCPGDQGTMVRVQRNGGDPNHRVACDCCGPSGPERVGTKNSVEDAGDHQEGITARSEEHPGRKEAT